MLANPIYPKRREKPFGKFKPGDFVQIVNHGDPDFDGKTGLILRVMTFPHRDEVAYEVRFVGGVKHTFMEYYLKKASFSLNPIYPKKRPKEDNRYHPGQMVYSFVKANADIPGWYRRAKVLSVHKDRGIGYYYTLEILDDYLVDRRTLMESAIVRDNMWGGHPKPHYLPGRTVSLKLGRLVTANVLGARYVGGQGWQYELEISSPDGTSTLKEEWETTLDQQPGARRHENNPIYGKERPENINVGDYVEVYRGPYKGILGTVVGIANAYDRIVIRIKSGTAVIEAMDGEVRKTSTYSNNPIYRKGRSRKFNVGDKVVIKKRHGLWFEGLRGTVVDVYISPGHIFTLNIRIPDYGIMAIDADLVELDRFSKNPIYPKRRGYQPKVGDLVEFIEKPDRIYEVAEIYQRVWSDELQVRLWDTLYGGSTHDVPVSKIRKIDQDQYTNNPVYPKRRIPDPQWIKQGMLIVFISGRYQGRVVEVIRVQYDNDEVRLAVKSMDGITYSFILDIDEINEYLAPHSSYEQNPIYQKRRPSAPKFKRYDIVKINLPGSHYFEKQAEVREVKKPTPDTLGYQETDYIYLLDMGKDKNPRMMWAKQESLELVKPYTGYNPNPIYSKGRPFPKYKVGDKVLFRVYRSQDLTLTAWEKKVGEITKVIQHAGKPLYEVKYLKHLGTDKAGNDIDEWIRIERFEHEIEPYTPGSFGSNPIYPKDRPDFRFKVGDKVYLRGEEAVIAKRYLNKPNVPIYAVRLLYKDADRPQPPPGHEVTRLVLETELDPREDDPLFNNNPIFPKDRYTNDLVLGEEVTIRKSYPSQKWAGKKGTVIGIKQRAQGAAYRPGSFFYLIGIQGDAGFFNREDIVKAWRLT